MFTRLFLKRLVVPALGVCFLAFVILSWWILFRDERALAGIEFFYPALEGQLFPVRSILLEYGLNVIPTVLFAGFSLVAICAYLLSLRESFPRKMAIRVAVVFQLIAFLSYPVLSTDIFSYIFSDRVFTQYGQNIWEVTPDTFPQDPFERLSDWKDQTKVYGAVNQIVYLPAAYLGNDDLFTTVLLYKLVAAAFGLASLALFLKLVQDLPKKQQSLAVRLIFWNPLFILEILGAGHNDIAMVFFLLASLLFWKEKKWLLSGVFLALSVQIKLIPVVFFGFFSLYLLQKRDFFAFSRFVGAFVLTNGIAFLYMQVNPLVFLERVLSNTSVYWQSLPALVERFFPSSSVPFTQLFIGLSLAFVVLQWVKKWHPVFTSSLTLLVYLLFFSAAYWNWYVLWLLVLIPFLKQDWIKNTILVFSFTSLLAYPLLWISQRFGFGNPLWSVVTFVWVFGVPSLVMMIGLKNPNWIQSLERRLFHV